MVDKVKATYAKVEKDEVKANFPTLHHPIHDLMLTEADPFTITTNAPDVRMCAYAQAMAHMGLTYVAGITPELVTCKISATAPDVRDGVWSPAYKYAHGTAASDTGYIFAQEIMHMNKSLKVNMTTKKLTIDRGSSAGDAWNDLKARVSATLGRLPKSTTATSTLDAADASDTVVCIKDAESNTYYMCPLVEPTGYWNGMIVRPPAFGGSGIGGPLPPMATPTLEQNHLQTDILEIDMLEPKDEKIDDEFFKPKALNAAAVALASSANKLDFVTAFFNSISDILPTQNGNDLADRGPSKVYGYVRFAETSAKDIRLKHMRVKPDSTAFYDMTATLVTNNAPSSSVTLQALYNTTYVTGNLTFAGSAAAQNVARIGKIS